MASALSGAAYDAEEASADGRRTVASEMEAIFAPLPRPAAPPTPPPSAKPTTSSRAGGRAWIGIVLLILVGLIAAAVSMVFLARTSRAPLPQRPARSAATQPAPAPILPPTALRPPIVAPLITPPPVASPPAAAAPRTPPERTKSKPIRHSTAHRSRPSKRDTRREAHSRRGQCTPGATSPWCLRGAVAQADDRLRDAYETAVRARVDRETLVGIRGDWKRLRGRANREPRALIRGYALLTQELRAEVRRAGRR